MRDNSFILVGGQNGTWFQSAQYPRLVKIFLENDVVNQLAPVLGDGRYPHTDVCCDRTCW